MYLRRRPIRFRQRAARPMPRKLEKRYEVLFSILLGVGFAVLMIHFINAQLRPVMTELAATQVRNAVTVVINDVVAKEVSKGQIDYDDVIVLDKDASGNVTALKNDMTQVNVLRSSILSALVTEVGEVDTRSLSIPLGNLTGIDLLSGRGPVIPVKVLTTGTADASFQNVFSDAGINQTRHQVMLDVTVPLSVLLPGYSTQTQVTAQVCVAETVIVGKVPDTYLQLAPGQQLVPKETT